MTTPLRVDGRWGGKVTRRELPANSPEIATLSLVDRASLANLWLSQSATERRVAESFAVVHRALVALSADKNLIEIAERGIDDEHRHAALCHHMAEQYAGRELATAPTLPFVHPAHREASSEAERQALFVIGQCVFNETLASAYLEAAMSKATAPIARAALSELLSDEIDHARIGWAFLSMLEPSARQSLQSWMLPLAVCNLREWRAVAKPIEHAEVLEAHGAPSYITVQEALLEGLSSLVVPGLQTMGFDVSSMRAWLDQGAVTA
ncbi:MAG: hypothetical protein Q8Q09_05035 [Deltaproteobacteria bacterium]|nr:hypothetical protein [Deltaproteobacteria bacterium]